MKKPKILFISESIRRDCHLPLKYFKDIEPIHFYLEAPYGDLSKDDLKNAQKISLKDLKDEIRKINPDVIQGPEPFGSTNAFKLSYSVYKAVKDTDTKLVIPVLENRPIAKRFSIIQRIVLRIFVPKYFSRADLFITLNKGAKRNIAYYVSDARDVDDVVWGVWGVDLSMFKPLGKKVTGKIGYIGRLVEDKGIWYLLNGFQKAVKEIPYLKLEVAGKGELEGEIKKFIFENKLEKNIKLIGFLNNDKLIDFMSSCELVAYPSITMPRWEEQVGTVNFQAMACGTPVLTTDSGAIAEYICDGRGAMIVKERSAEAIEEGIDKFFSDRDYARKLSQQARDYISRYDVKEQVKKAEKIILKLIDE